MYKDGAWVALEPVLAVNFTSPDNSMPTEDEYWQAVGITTTEAAAKGLKLEGWYYEEASGAKKEVTNIFASTHQNKNFYPIITREITLQLADGSVKKASTIFDGAAKFGTSFSFYMSNIKDLESYIWTDDQDDQVNIAALNFIDLDANTTFKQGAELESFIGARSLATGDEEITKMFLLRYLQDNNLAGATDTVVFTTSLPTEVKWAAGEPPAAGAYLTEEHFASYQIGYTVNGGESAIVDLKIYPILINVGMYHRSYTVQGSNIMVGAGYHEDDGTFLDPAQYGGTGYYTGISGGSLSLESFDFRVNNFYSDSQFSIGGSVNLYSSIDLVMDWYKNNNNYVANNYDAFVIEHIAKNNIQFPMLYKGAADLYLTTADVLQGYPQLDGQGNYHIANANARTPHYVFAADSYADSKVYDGFGYTMGDAATTNIDSAAFLAAIEGDIAPVINSLDNGQQLVVRFWDEASQSSTLSTFTTPADVDVYYVPFKIFVANYDAAANEYEVHAAEAESVSSSDNAYIATITITPAQSDDPDRGDDPIPGGEEVIIEEDTTPLADVPTPEQPTLITEEEVVIVEDETPLGNLPQTGAVGVSSSMFALLGMAILSGLGLTLKKRK